MKCIEDEIPFEVPEGWVWARMSSLTHNLPYGTSKKSSSRGEIAVLRMGNLQQGEIDYTDLVYSSDKEDIGKYLLTAGDLLFNRTNSSEWVGKTAIYRGELAAIYAGYLIRIRPFLEGEYLNCVMNSGYIKEICLLVKTDAVNQSNINATKLGRFLIPVPPFNEQLKISKKVFETLYWINFIVTEKNELGQCIQQIKSKILDLAIRGQLVPQNPDDEPASVLLEHIRAEKEELIRHGKIKRDKTESVIFKGDDNSYYETNYGDIKKCIDDEIIFKLPVGWSWCRMHQLFNITSSKRVLQSDWCNEGIPFYRAREIVKLSDNGYVDNDLFISLEHYQKIKEEYGIPQRGDLMVTGVGTIGKVYIVQENDKFYYKDASVLCFENRTGYVDSKFARYLIESDLIQNQIIDFIALLQFQYSASTSVLHI